MHAKRYPRRWVAAGLVLAALVVAAPALAAEAVGWVTEIEGVVEVQHADGAAWAALAPAAEVAVGDHVRTASDGRAKVLLRDDSVLTLAPDAELVLDEQTAGPVPQTQLELVRGKMRAIVTERYGTPGSRFELQTRNAITGVRGTSFVASYDAGADDTMVVGVSHTTAVRARHDAAVGREVRLGPGDVTHVRRGSYPTAPARLPDATLRNLLSSTTVRPNVGAAGSAGKGTIAEPRVPRRSGDRNGSPEERTIDQPVDLLRRGPGGVPPPPPPVPR